MIKPYASGADMWRDYLESYGEIEAHGICNRYLNMQVFNKDPEEIQFCKELYAAMPKTITKSSQKPSILDDLAEKTKDVQNIQKKSDERSQQEELY